LNGYTKIIVLAARQEKTFLPWSIISEIPPTSPAMQSRPQAMASSKELGMPSSTEGRKFSGHIARYSCDQISPLQSPHQPRHNTWSKNFAIKIVAASTNNAGQRVQ
jgi:hypothetical protein